MRRAAFIAASIAVLVGFAAASGAQTATQSSERSISVGYEVHRDHLRYLFENPSSVTTTFLVPHNFVQTYVANNQWLVATGRYPLLGDVMESEFGLTPRRDTFASDLDTFFNPDNDIVVSGTMGDATTRALRFAQWAEGRLWSLSLRLGYLYRRDTTEFRSTERIVTHSNPPSDTRTSIQTHETTISQVHEAAIGLSKQRSLTPGWRITAGADVSPLTIARLTTILPEKYPGQRILFVAKGAALAGSLQLDQTRSRWPLAITIGYGRTWSYRASSQFRRDALQIGVRVGIYR